MYFMRKIFYSLLLIIATTSIKAQVSGKHIGSTGVGGDLSIQDNNGKMIPIGAQEDTKGNPLLLDYWTFGTVYLKNGIKFTDTALNFSLFEDKLYFKRDNQFYIVAGVISEFVLTPSGAAADTIPFRFINGYPATSTSNENSFFQILNDGKKYQLLKWQHKKIRDAYSYGGKAETEYVNQLAYYIYDRSSRKMLTIGSKANSANIKNTLSVDESTWKAYSENHPVNTKSEKAMIEFAGYLNSL